MDTAWQMCWIGAVSAAVLAMPLSASPEKVGPTPAEIAAMHHPTPAVIEERWKQVQEKEAALAAFDGDNAERRELLWDLGEALRMYFEVAKGDGTAFRRAEEVYASLAEGAEPTDRLSLQATAGLGQLWAFKRDFAKAEAYFLAVRATVLRMTPEQRKGLGKAYGRLMHISKHHIMAMHSSAGPTDEECRRAFERLLEANRHDPELVAAIEEMLAMFDEVARKRLGRYVYEFTSEEQLGI